MRAVTRTLAVYAVELAAGIAVGVGFFLLMLWLLSVAFPDATGLGSMVRARSEAGGVSALFIDGPGSAVATLSDLRGNVRDKPDSSVSWSTALEGSALGDRHAVQSYDASGATIVFDDANRLELGERSVIVVRRPRRVAGSFRRRATVNFVDGFLRGKFGGGAAGGLDVELIAAGGAVRPVAGADGQAEIALAVDRDTSSLSVTQGAVEIAWGDDVTVVPEGHMVTYDGETPPSRPMRSPDQPRLVAPADARRFDYRSAPPEIELSWIAPRAEQVQLQIARDEEFVTMVFDDLVDGSTLSHQNLVDGTYWWRVVPFRGGLAGPRSPTHRIVVRRDAEAPELLVDFPADTVQEQRFHLTGQTEPGSRVVIGPVTLRADADGRFEYLLPLRDGYNFVVVQSIDAAGNTAFANHPIIAELPETGSVQ